MYQLSVICPSIRTHRLLELYESISKSFSGTWELIVVSPYALPPELEAKDNVQWIESWRSPLACQQMGLIASKGELISWCADDGICLPNSYDIAFKSIENEPYTTIVTGKYQEGERVNDNMEVDWYYKLSNHDSMKLPGVPKDALMLNCGIVHRSLLFELGGWDSSLFQACPLGYSDFAIRAYKFGCKFILQPEVMFSCTHEPGMTGSHGPIHLSQTYHDQPLFSGIYSTPSAYLLRHSIPIDNWKKSAEKWNERFGN